MITHEQIPDFYDWLSRFVQVSNWLSYRDRFAAFTMHKRLDVATQAVYTYRLDRHLGLQFNMIRKTSLAFPLVALTLNGVVVIDNYVLASNPFSKWRDAVDVSTSPNSPAYFSFEQTIAAPLTAVTATGVSSGQVVPWDVSSGQVLCGYKSNKCDAVGS